MHVCVQTGAMLLFLETLKNFDVCSEGALGSIECSGIGYLTQGRLHVFLQVKS